MDYSSSNVSNDVVKQEVDTIVCVPENVDFELKSEIKHEPTAYIQRPTIPVTEPISLTAESKSGMIRI